MDNQSKESLIHQFENWSTEKLINFEPLAQAGSNRLYFRLTGKTQSAIGVYNPNIPENQAFIQLAKQLKKYNISAPSIYAKGEMGFTYLQEDLGNKSLFQEAIKAQETGNFPIQLYRQALEQLVLFQVNASKDWDYELCYPDSTFGKTGIIRDLQYFHYYFFRPSEINYDQDLLEQDFEKLADFLLSAPADYLLYRDFQARNIMLHDDQTYFIDFQGARKGPLQYDLASILFQAKAQIPHEVRAELLGHYLEVLQKHQEVDEKAFIGQYYYFVLLRTLQVLGAYGYRGLFERKSHFIESIPYAFENLQWLLNQIEDFEQFPYLHTCLLKLSEQSEKWQKTPRATADSKLKVHIYSFSFKKGWPASHAEHGGGYVFDCRALHNPGRYQPYKALTGHDEPVKIFLENNSRVASFLKDIYSTVDPSIEKYLERGFDHLSVSFGCTGGQHRSVYCAERMRDHLEEKYGVEVMLYHREQAHLN